MMSYSLRRPLAVGLSALIVALLAGGCGEKPAGTAATGGPGGGKSGGGGKGGKGGGGPAPVIVATAKKKVVPLVIEAIGAVEPIRTTSVRSQVTGTLLKRVIQEGQDVKEGDILFEIDPRPFKNALRSAEADLEKFKVQRETARAQVARYQTLGQMISKEQFQKIQDDARSLDATVLAEEAAVANAKLQLEYCTIRAPLAGRTGNMNVHEGDIVRANDSGSPIVTINQISPIYVTFGVPQQYLGALTRYRAAGMLKVTVVPPGNDEKPENGELTFLDNMVDSATGTLKLKGTFPNAGQRLWPGQFTTVTVTLDSPDVLTIASSAVQTSQTGQHVFVVKDQIAEQRTVVVERTYGTDAVITKGLTEGETVVIDGQLRVIPGRPVEIKEGGASGGGGGGGGRGEGGKGKKKKET